MAEDTGADLEATLERYLAYRVAVDEGREAWDGLVRFFTDDAVFIDPAWGRIEGLEQIHSFLVESMTGLEDWSFPVDFVTVEGDKVIVKFRQILPGTRADGSRYEQSGYSTLLYAGGGKFRYEEDVLNMAHLYEDLAAIGWTPPKGMTMPPSSPNRDFSDPAGATR